MTFTPRTWVVGEVVSAATMNQEIRDQFASMFDAWTAYTPTMSAVSSAPALGNGTLTGQYMKWGRSVHMSLQLTLGSSTTMGSGNISFSLPVTAASAAGGKGLTVAISRAGTPNFAMGGCPVGNNATTTGTIWMPSVSTTGDWDAWTSLTPWSLAAGDIVRIWGTYQSAS